MRPALSFPSPRLAAVTTKLQSLGLAVLANGATEVKCDGVHLDALVDDVALARRTLGKDLIVGAFCAASRHAAMQAAEDGADYIALSQNTYTPSEPIIGWWADLFEIPCVAFDPVEAGKARHIAAAETGLYPPHGRHVGFPRGSPADRRPNLRNGWPDEICPVASPPAHRGRTRRWPQPHLRKPSVLFEDKEYKSAREIAEPLANGR